MNGMKDFRSLARFFRKAFPSVRMTVRVRAVKGYWGLTKQDGSQVNASGYGGWVRFQFWHSNRCMHTVWLYHYHGTGGGGPVTRGTIQTNRIAVFTPDADIVLTGHTHDEWIMPIRRQRISDHGKVYHDEQLHIRAPGYKDAWDDGHAGWEIERMLGPKPIGSMWLYMQWHDGKAVVEPIRAK